jgi:hypothetical protein
MSESTGELQEGKWFPYVEKALMKAIALLRS